MVDPRAARDCSGLLVQGAQRTLIDAPPELRLQLVREGVSGVEQVLLTHEHFDHVGGLPQLEFYVRYGTRRPLPVYAGAEAIAAVKQQYAFMLDTLELRPIKAFETVSLDGVNYTALPAAHSKGSFGYLIEVPGQVPQNPPWELGEGQVGETRMYRYAYFPDTGPPLPETLERLEGLDVFIVDSTFSGTNWSPKTHHSIDEAIALAQRLQPRQTYLTHLAMHFDEPITLAQLEQRLPHCTCPITIAHDGLTIPLG